MGHQPFVLRVWLTMAVTAASLALTSSASAIVTNNDDGGPIVVPKMPVATPRVSDPVSSSGFDWTLVAISVAAALVVIALAYLARNRVRVAASH